MADSPKHLGILLIVPKISQDFAFKGSKIPVIAITYSVLFLLDTLILVSHKILSID